MLIRSLHPKPLCEKFDFFGDSTITNVTWIKHAF